MSDPSPYLRFFSPRHQPVLMANRGFRYASYHTDHGGDTESAEAPEEDEFIGSFFQIDLSARYMVTPYAQIFGDIVNLTNERFTLYMGREDRPRPYEWYERWGRIGVRYTL